MPKDPANQRPPIALPSRRGSGREDGDDARGPRRDPRANWGKLYLSLAPGERVRIRAGNGESLTLSWTLDHGDKKLRVDTDSARFRSVAGGARIQPTAVFTLLQGDSIEIQHGIGEDCQIGKITRLLGDKRGSLLFECPREWDVTKPSNLF